MKIVVLDGYTLNPGDLSWADLEALGEVQVYDRTKQEDLFLRISQADIVLTNKTPLDKATLLRCPKLQYIGVLATGYNVVDVEAAHNQGIIVTNIPTYGTEAVAQFTIALLLEICHHIGEHSRSVLADEWTNHQDWCYWNRPLVELAGKTLGLIGFGRIGQRTAHIAQALGMTVLAYDKNHDPSLENSTCRYVTLEELLGLSDVISLHCPLFPDTQNLINENTISKMKDGVILINTSRGPLIQEAHLAQALDSGKIGAAAVDVVSLEPIAADNPLLKAKNIHITPHIAWAPKESRQRLLGIAVANLNAFLKDDPVNMV